jgi:hypothetical protein
MAGQHAEAGRIHVWNLSQIKEVCGRLLVVWRRFEDVAKGVGRQGVVHISPGEWSVKSKDRALRFAFTAFNGEPCAFPNLSFNGWHGISFEIAVTWWVTELARLSSAQAKECRGALG